MPREIACPQCQSKIVVEDILAGEIEKELRQKMTVEWQKRSDEFKQERMLIKQEKNLLELQIQQQDAVIADKLKESRKLIEAEALRLAQEELHNKMVALQDDRDQKERQLTDLRDRELQLLREKTDLESQGKDLERQMEKRFLESRHQIEENAARKEREIGELKLLELQKKLEQQTKLAEEIQRKAEQGSMQLQGEVQELALESLLKASFPLDEIREVGKGKKGADSILVVKNNQGQECGKIVYECKRTQDFGKDWIEKVKLDMQIVNADMAVIVTQAMPKDMDERFGHREGVWICTFSDVRSLTVALRDSLIRVHQVSRTHENKGDKMQLLYNYLTSNEFAMQWNAIREGFRIMHQSIGRERDVMEKLWKAREKQLEKVLTNAAHIRGSVEGIAGADAVDIRLLENEPEDTLF